MMPATRQIRVGTSAWINACGFASRCMVALLLQFALLAHESTLHGFLMAQIAPPESSTAPGGTCPLTIELAGPTGVPIDGVVRVTETASGKPVNLPAHLWRPMGWYSLASGATIEVPPGELRIEACHGLETEIAAATLRVRAGSRANHVKLTLRSFYDPRARRLTSANTHLHLILDSPVIMGVMLRSRQEAEAYICATGKSDGLDLVYVSYLIRPGQHYISNEFTAEDLRRLSDDRLRFVNGEEYRHDGGRTRENAVRYGHVMLLDLPRLILPASIGRGFTPGVEPSDRVPLQWGIREARTQGAAAIWCHGRQGTEDVPNWVAGVLDAQNIYDGGNEGTVETVFYPYLNTGLRVPFSTGTDWGNWDFSRVYVPLETPVTSQAFLNALARGRSFITNGTFLEFEVDEIGPVTRSIFPAGRPVRVRARGIGRDDFGRIELVYNGAVAASSTCRRVDGHFVSEMNSLLEIREPGWLALRIPTELPYQLYASQVTGPGTNLFGKPLFAHTSPVYVQVAGKNICRPDAIQQLIGELDASIDTISAKGAFANETERDRLLSIYRTARVTLNQRMTAAGGGPAPTEPRRR